MSIEALIRTRLDQLAACTDVPGEITRLFLGPAHAQAINLVEGWMQEAGLVTNLDASGTLVGTQGDADAPILLLGSHIDSVRNAGRYDGCLGVVLAIATAYRLRDQPLPFTLQVRAFGDEEGIRFPVTLTGAHATAGRFDPAWLGACDADGVSLGDALRAFGLNPAGIHECAVPHALAYLEAHIEQGPVLEAAGQRLGVVTAIAGAARYTAVVTGQVGHAGTVPMAQRRDALVAAAAMVGAVADMARAFGGCAATVGQLTVSPNVVNAIPGACTFTMDIRAADDAIRTDVETAILDRLHEIACQHDVMFTAERTHAAPAVACDDRLQGRLGDALTAAGLPAPRLPSGAGHDAMAIAARCPIGMLFIRCAGGISHHPDEHVADGDIAAAFDVLTSCVRSFDPAAFRRIEVPAWT